MLFVCNSYHDIDTYLFAKNKDFCSQFLYVANFVVLSLFEVDKSLVLDLITFYLLMSYMLWFCKREHKK